MTPRFAMAKIILQLVWLTLAAGMALEKRDLCANIAIITDRVNEPFCQSLLSIAPVTVNVTVSAAAATSPCTTVTTTATSVVATVTASIVTVLVQVTSTVDTATVTSVDTVTAAAASVNTQNVLIKTSYLTLYEGAKASSTAYVFSPGNAPPTQIQLVAKGPTAAAERPAVASPAAPVVERDVGDPADLEYNYPYRLLSAACNCISPSAATTTATVNATSAVASASCTSTSTVVSNETSSITATTTVTDVVSLTATVVTTVQSTANAPGSFVNRNFVTTVTWATTTRTTGDGAASTTTSTLYPCAEPLATNIPTLPYGDAVGTDGLNLQSNTYAPNSPQGSSALACCEACFFNTTNCISANYFSFQGCVISSARNTADVFGSKSAACPAGSFKGLSYNNDTNPALKSTGNFAGPCGAVYSNVAAPPSLPTISAGLGF